MRAKTAGPRFGVVVSRFNSEITGSLLESCLKNLRRAGVTADRLRVVHVPGAFEIPWAIQELSLSGRFDVTIALGAVLQGETPQNDFISATTFSSLQRVSLATGVPCALGIITPRTYEQALARTRGTHDRGAEAAQAALELARLRSRLRRATAKGWPADG